MDNRDIYTLLSRYLAHIIAYRFALLGIIDRFSFYGLPVKYWITPYSFRVYRNKKIIYARDFDDKRIEFWFGQYNYLYICADEIIYKNKYISLEFPYCYIKDDNGFNVLYINFLAINFEILLYTSDILLTRFNIGTITDYDEYYHNSRQLIYTIRYNTATIYYQSGALLCNIAYSIIQVALLSANISLYN